MVSDERSRQQDPEHVDVMPFGEALQAFLTRLHDYQVAVAADRQAAAEDRRAAAEDRKAAAWDRELAAWARQQAAGFSDLGSEASAFASDADPGSEPRMFGPGTELNIALRFATVREAEALDFAQHAAALAKEVARSEQRVASTLRDLDSGSPVHTARRLALAEEAVKGADEALRRGERLRGLADQARAHLEQATLRVLLSRASTAFTELSRAERAIAEALELLAEHEEADAADSHRGDAQQAAAAAEVSLERAAELHRLEVDTGSAGDGSQQPTG